MKKFISALTSLAIATTALGGTIVMSADAADKTIIEFRTGDSNAINAKAGDTIPVTVYVPQCTGANTFSLKMSINGNETLGKDVEETADELELIKKEAANAKTAEDKAAYEAVEHWLYGNYGIKTANEKFAKPYCFDSGIYQDGNPGGNYKLSYAYFLENTWNISLTLNTFVGANANADAYAPWVDAGEPDEYDDYTPVTKWTKDEAWAYKYALATFDLVLPDNLPDGEYKLDLLTDKYINVVSHQFAQTSVSGVDGAVEFESVPLVITVGNGKTPGTTEATKPTEASKTETTAAVTTTEGTKAETEAPKITEAPVEIKEKPAPKEGTVQYDMIARDKENGFDGKNNTVSVKPGEEFTVQWVVKNDPGTAGMQMHFDFSDLTFKKRKAGDAYEVGVQWNKSTYAYVFASDETMKAADDAVISTFTFTAPDEKGTYIITTKDTDGPCIVRPLLDEDPDIPVAFYGLAVTVGDDVTPNTTAASTTEAESTTVTTTTTEPETSDSKSDTTAATETTEATVRATETEASTTAGNGDVLYGDVNLDGEIRINDVVILNKYVANKTDLNDQQKKNANCVNDANIDLADSTAIKKFLAKLIPQSDLGKKA